MNSSEQALLPNSKEWFDAVSEDGLRGLQGQAGCIHYADYILQTIRPSLNARIVDLGCGDGGVMRAMGLMRPDLTIEGWDFSAQQIEKAKKSMPDQGKLLYRTVDLKSSIPQGKPVDHFFSFSVIQYFSVEDFASLNRNLLSRLACSGAISHLSIPDLAKRSLLFQADWLDHGNPTPLRAALHALEMIAVDAKRRWSGDRRYGTSLFHDSTELASSAPEGMSATVRRPSDSWYRFDVHLR